MMKSGYILASHLNRPPEVLPHVDWTFLWKLRIPPKVREFLWRALRGVLPTKGKLAQRGMNYGTLCGCGADPETLDLALLHCPAAASVWHLWGCGGSSTSLSFVNCFAALRASSILHLALDYFQEWTAAQQRRRTPLPRSPASTSNATGDSSVLWKCYTDAAIFDSSRSFGSGSVTCATDGTFLHAFSTFCHGSVPPKVAEAIALRSSLEQVSTRCLGPGLVFSDAQEVVQAVSSDVEDWSEYGNIIEDCRQLLRQCVDIKVSWIRRVANGLAHCLARSLFGLSLVTLVMGEPSSSLGPFPPLPSTVATGSPPVSRELEDGELRASP
ncbi:hypothetical protein K2173_006531 [Erythroxylum novogranatense]|uniref:Reverse transcriptase zinc-binding domain-containing protein n=1 Tax=Erythroxylum novogranatense TaxID=1862640 RepID=A0AAV8T6E1_9ROSI|nr:hypothetical protein K2173_006531 [Erythroxylum novogranatense]